MKGNVPKVLVISHTPFSSSDAMGSTLASYFKTYDPEKIAQFFIKNISPDLPICKNYYRVTDSDIVKKIIHPFKYKIVGKVNTDKKTDLNNLQKGKEIKVSYNKRALGLLLRNFVWSTKVWYNKELKKWLNDFSPDIILLQPGDFSYLFKFATKLSKKLDIPLVIHQSEAYYLKPYFKKDPIYLFYRYDFKKIFEKTMKRASLCIYLCDALEKDYSKFFNTPSCTIYKSTNIEPKLSQKELDKNSIKFIYGGNLGETVGRCEPLKELGTAVKENGYYIDVYTSSTGPHMSELTEENGIKLHAAISNAELQKKVAESDFVVHIENQSEWHKTDEKYAFSTKIADMLASGTCALVYGSTQIAGIKYFNDNELACVIENKEELVNGIKKLINDSELRNKYVKNAYEKCVENHNAIKNSDLTKEKLIQVFLNYKKRS